MKLASVMRPFVALPQNEEDPVDDLQRARRIRDARVAAARRAGWEELPAERIERRDRWWLVDVATDSVFTLYRGVVFERGSARLIIDQMSALAFYVDGDGELVVIERQPGTWSEIAAKRAKRRS